MDGSPVGAGAGTAVLVVGGATASLSGGEPAGGSPDSSTDAVVVPPLDTAAALDDGAALVGGPVPTPSEPPPTDLTTDPIAGPSPLVGLFDVRNLYLLVAACALGCWGMGQLIRTLEVRD